MASKGVAEPLLRLTRPVRRIVILRANGLGDFLLATPALRALARGFPEAEVTYLCRPSLRALIAGRYPYIHRALALPWYPKLNEPPAGASVDAAAVEAFIGRLRAERPDLAIQMHGGGVESNPFVARLGAAHTLGLSGRTVPSLEANIRYVFYQSEPLRYLELIEALGVPPAGIDLELPVLPADRERLAGQPALAGLTDYAVLHPGAGDVRRRWPLERFARVAEVLHRRFGLTVVVGGDRGERGLATGLRQLARAPIVDVAGALDLGAYAALLERARLFVGNDTGPAHMAAALAVPSVVVFWCGNLITAGAPGRQRYRPVLSWTVDCPACGRRDCRCPVSFVQEAPLAEVLEHVEDLLADPRTWARSP